MPDRDPMTVLAVTMDQLIDAVKVLTSKLDTLQNEKVASLITLAAVQENKIAKLERIVYGSATAIALQFLAALVGALIWAIKR